MIFVPIIILLDAIFRIPLLILPSSGGFDFSTWTELRHIFAPIYAFNYMFPITEAFSLMFSYIQIMIIFWLGYFVLYLVRMIRGN